MKRSFLLLLFLVFTASTFAQERVYVPTQKYPENNGINQMPDVIVSWYAITGTLDLKYRFQMDTTAAFTSPLLIDTTQTLITGYKTNELFFGRKYFWRVRAIDNGQTSAWSAIWNFTVFNSVDLNTPLVNAVKQDPNVPIAWYNTIGAPKKTITGITHYDYQVDLDTNFNSPNLIHGTTSSTVLKANTANLRFGTKYYWRVRAGHGKANSAYCPFRSFTVIEKFELQAPLNGAAKVFLNAQLKWKAVNGLLSYAFQIAKDQAFNDLVAESEVDTTFILAYDLQFGVKYYWRVCGRHLTDTSQWSDPYSFTTINTVDLKNPANNQELVPVKPLMQWTKQTGIINYELWIDSDSLFGNPFIKFKPGPNDIQYQVSKTLLYDKKYFWKMRVFSDGGIMNDTSAWSPVWSFRTVTPAGLEEKGVNSFSVYPNPSSGKIFLKIDSRENVTAGFELIDLLGKKVMETPVDITVGNNVKEMTLENVNKGIYMIRLTINGNSVNRKLVIDK